MAGNRIEHKRIIIDYDVWQPFKLEAEKDLDQISDMLKTKGLLKHCGNVHMSFEDIKEI